MKKNVTAPKKHGRIIVTAVAVGIAVLVLAVWGAKIAFDRMQHVYLLQCCVTNAGEQVEVAQYVSDCVGDNRRRGECRNQAEQHKPP